MKKLSLALLVTTIYFSSCSTGRMASTNTDDVYYSDRDATANRYDRNDNTSPAASTSSQNNSGSSQQSSDGYSNPNNQNGDQSYQGTNNSSSNPSERFNDNSNQPDNSTSERTTDENGNTYVTNNYYNDDDYYDYAYSSRIRHFYHPYGWNYYDPYYTNLYWYDYDPFSYGVSLYLTYNWWRPQYVWTPGFSVSFGYGNPYYNNWYGGYNSYYNGYSNGYINGYYNGIYNGSFNPNYFNSKDSYSYYYGPHNSRGSAIANNSPRVSRNLSELYGNAVASGNPRNPKLVEAGDGIVAIGRPKRADNFNNTGVPGKLNSAADNNNSIPVRNHVNNGVRNSNATENVNHGGNSIVPATRNQGGSVRTNMNDHVKNQDSHQRNFNMNQQPSPVENNSSTPATTPRYNQGVNSTPGNSPVDVQPTIPARESAPRNQSPRNEAKPRSYAPAQNQHPSNVQVNAPHEIHSYSPSQGTHSSRSSSGDSESHSRRR